MSPGIIRGLFFYPHLLSHDRMGRNGVPGCLSTDIYAVNPVDEIIKLNDDRLRTLARWYALGIAVEGQDSLNENDAVMFSFLSRMELRRRTATKNEFSLLLQEEKEKLQPLIKGRGDVTTYIKMDNWIDFYQLKLIVG